MKGNMNHFIRHAGGWRGDFYLMRSASMRRVKTFLAWDRSWRIDRFGSVNRIRGEALAPSHTSIHPERTIYIPPLLNHILTDLDSHPHFRRSVGSLRSHCGAYPQHQLGRGLHCTCLLWFHRLATRISCWGIAIGHGGLGRRLQSAESWSHWSEQRMEAASH